MKEVIKKFGADLEGFKKEVPAVELQLNTRRHMLYVGGSKEDKQRVEGMISELILWISMVLFNCHQKIHALFAFASWRILLSLNPVDTCFVRLAWWISVNLA
jgi:hypothetical protein